MTTQFPSTTQPTPLKDYIEIENNASHCAWAESADTCELGENLLCLFSTNFLDGGVQRSITTEVTTLWLEGHSRGMPLHWRHTMICWAI